MPLDRFFTAGCLRAALVVTAMLAWGCSQESQKSPQSDQDAESPISGTLHGHFLTLSDIHFDPYFDQADASNPCPGGSPNDPPPPLAWRLYQADVSRWKGILEGTIAAGQNGLQDTVTRDTNYPLLKSALAAAADQVKALPDKKVDYVVITGDFLGHNFDRNFSDLLGRCDPSAGDPFNEYKSFVLKTMSFIADELSAAFPDTPIYPAIGNNDAYCGDYGVSQGSDFLTDLKAIWAPLAQVPLNDFSKSGSYTVKPVKGLDLQLVVYNNVPLSRNYPNPSIFSSSDDSVPGCPGDLESEEQSWLSTVLQKATGQVALAFHIPPGIDQYNTANDQSLSCDQPYAMADSDFDLARDQSQQLIGTLGGAMSKISYAMVAHTHVDDFRLFQIPTSPGSHSPLLFHFNPSFSLRNGNNPGFQIFTYQPSDGTLLDYTTYYLTNLSSAKIDDPQSAPDWQPLYTYSQDYLKKCGLAEGNYDAGTVASLIDQLGSDATCANETYRQFYTLKASTVSDSEWPVYLCSLSHLTAEGFMTCYCKATSDGAA